MMTFIETEAREQPPYPSLAPEIAALQRKRRQLISMIAEAADTISRIDNRIHNLRSYGEMDRPRAGSKTTTKAATARKKAAGEA